MQNRTFILLVIVCAFAFRPASLLAQDTMRTFIFGHSLINHALQVNPTPSQETSVPHWFHFLSVEANRRYEVSGQYGFIPQHANLPPIAQWGFDSVPPAWDDLNETFAEADFDNILITPANFAQWQPPTVPYWMDSLSPIQYTTRIFDWANQQEDSLTFFIYENWPDMAPYLNNGFPPTQAEWTSYNNYLNGAFHDWFLEYHDSMRAAFPNHCVRMIPVGPVISSLLATSPFDQIAIDTLYEDDAPHGRPTIYFLAALATYMAMHEERPPMGYQVPAIVDPIVANNYVTAVNHIWDELVQFRDSLGNNRVFCNPPVLLAYDEEEGGALTEAALAVDDLVLYPNPSRGQLAIQTGMENYDVSIYDLNGRLLREVGESPRAIDLAGLTDGLYLVRVRDRIRGAVSSRKLLLRR